MEYANALITVRFAGPTDTKGSRWIVNATITGDDLQVRRIIHRDHGVYLEDDAHAAAATALTALAEAVRQHRVDRALSRDLKIQTTGTFVARHVVKSQYTFLARVSATYLPATTEVTL